VNDSPWFVYLLVCRNGRIYTGVTPDLERRITAHRLGKGAKFTKSNPPERLLAVKSCAGKIAAMRLEAQVKRMRREVKISQATAWAIEHPVDELSERLLRS
jgi:putative endonuclease